MTLSIKTLSKWLVISVESSFWLKLDLHSMGLVFMKDSSQSTKSGYIVRLFYDIEHFKTLSNGF